MTLEVNVNIPALDRLCNLIAAKEVTGIAEAIESSLKAAIESSLKAALDGEPAPETVEAAEAEADVPENVAPFETPAEAPETAPEPAPTIDPPAAVESEPAPAPEPTAPAEPVLAPVKIETIQRAAAKLRDEGKLKAVTALFPTYGIDKLSGLKPEQTGAFAEELRKLGAEI